MLRVALLGAESSGKTHLAHALARYAEQSGLRVQIVSELLRTWCEDHQRTPHADEQMQLAQQQDRVLHRSLREARQALPPVDLFIADTCPLQTAAYRAYYFEDLDLDAWALRTHAQNFDFSLLMGLDLPWIADLGQRTGRYSQLPVDGHLRRLLTHLPHHPYAVVYGQGPARRAAAWQALQSLLPLNPSATSASDATPVQPTGRWQASCECCADPPSERRLFEMIRNT
jgi:nicotinamide riboside kinase